MQPWHVLRVSWGGIGTHGAGYSSFGMRKKRWPRVVGEGRPSSLDVRSTMPGEERREEGERVGDKDRAPHAMEDDLLIESAVAGSHSGRGARPALHSVRTLLMVRPGHDCH